MATNKINFSYYEKLFWHFGFGDDHLLREAISANIYSHNPQVRNQCGTIISIVRMVVRIKPLKIIHIVIKKNSTDHPAIK